MLIILFVFITGPFLCGELVCSVISRKRKGSCLSEYPIGLVAVLCIFMAAVFMALKFDMDLSELKDWFIRLLGATELIGLGVFSYNIFKNRVRAKEPRRLSLNKSGIDCSVLFFFVPAVLLAIECFFILEPSYVNNDTIERTMATLSSKELYISSALTGSDMTVGLPIWSKIQIMPLFYAVMAEASGLPIGVFTRVIVPLLLYVINIAIMWSISERIMPGASGRRRLTFMCVYLCILYAGTYISDYGVVTTTGYALLRETYSGFAVCFALAFPLCFIYILKKKYLAAAFSLIPVAGLIRADIYVNILLKDGANAFLAVNESGKLWGIWLIAMAVLAVMIIEKKVTIQPLMILCPSATIAYTVENLGHIFENRKKQIIYYLGVGIIIFAACGFLPCDDAVIAAEEARTNEEILKCIEIIENNLGDIPVKLYSTKDVMARVRRSTENIEVLYGRDVYQRELNAYDFESKSPYTDDYIYYSLEWVEAYDCYTLSCEIPELVEQAASEGVNAVIVVNPARPEETGAQLAASGFVRLNSPDGYMICIRY